MNHHQSAIGTGLYECAPLDLLIEIKTFPDRPKATLVPDLLAGAIIRALRATGGIDRTALYAFDWRVLEATAKFAPELRRSCLTAPETVAHADLRFGEPARD